jgi:hypothetical protein
MFAADSSVADTQIILANSGNGTGEKQQARIKLISGSYFTTLGLKPAAGRFFGDEVDRQRGGSPVAVVSYSFWKQHYGLDPAVLGKTIQIHQTSFEIIGVGPPGFLGETVGQSPDAWVPMLMQESVYPGQDYLTASPQGLVNEYEWIQVVGRFETGSFACPGQRRHERGVHPRPG